MKTKTEGTPTFADLGLREELIKALSELGYEEPTPIQQAAIPALLEGRDVLGQAATGTGKTAAFALPILNKLEQQKRTPFTASALVLVPTRELAIQVAEATHSYGKHLGVSVLPIYGGQPFDQQLRRLKHGVDVVIATPGRALDHLRRKTLKLGPVRFAVVDEADEMLDLGFAEDLDALLAEVPEEAQVALFSATMAKKIAALAERHLDNPVRLRVEADAKTRSIPKITQTAYVVPRAMKDVALGRVLDLEAPQSALIFCRTRVEVEDLAERLDGHGYEVAALHGGMDQNFRERVIKALRAGEVQIVVATDVAARGLDVEKLSHVINYDLPNAPETYVHRIGRTGRAGREGKAITFCEPREHRLLQSLERHTGQKIDIAQVPTAIDLRARQLEQTRAIVEEALAGGALERYRGVVEQLCTNAEPMEVAAAAIAAVHGVLNPEREEDEAEIPAFQAAAPRKERPTREREPSRDREPRAAFVGTRVFVGLGRLAGLRPADLVGAIANEAGVDRAAIGAIQIAEQYAFVEIADEHAKHVVNVLRGTTIRGRKVRVDIDKKSRGER